MDKHKKTLIGSVIAFIIGTSCCWVSSILLWIGATGIMVTVVNYLEDIREIVIEIGLLLALVSMYFKKRQKRKRHIDK